MDPKFNGDDWTTDEIEMVRSLIASHGAHSNSSCTKNSNAMHYRLMDELHARLPRKDKRQVIDLYVDVLVDMVANEKAMGNQLPMVVRNDPVVDNFGVTENPGVHNMDEMKAQRTVEEQHHSKDVVPEHDKQRERRSWTLDEHRNFLLGLCAHGRGNWKKISKDFVTTKTPVQVSRHGQKFFRRQESTTKKRYSINDVSLYDVNPWAQDKYSSSWEALPFTSNAYNPYCYGSGGQLASMDNLSQVYSPFQCPACQASSSQTVTWTGGQQTPIRSFATPKMEEEDGTQIE